MYTLVWKKFSHKFFSSCIVPPRNAGKFVSMSDMKNQKSKKVVKTPHILDSITGQIRAWKIPHLFEYPIYYYQFQRKLLGKKNLTSYKSNNLLSTVYNKILWKSILPFLHKKCKFKWHRQFYGKYMTHWSKYPKSKKKIVFPRQFPNWY